MYPKLRSIFVEGEPRWKKARIPILDPIPHPVAPFWMPRACLLLWTSAIGQVKAPVTKNNSPKIWWRIDAAGTLARLHFGWL